MARNPNWTRDESILALDLYFRLNPLLIDEKHPELVQLSRILNALPIHAKSQRLDTFRNPVGVYMKLCNLLRLDPNYQGKGLVAGSKLDEEVWKEFYSNREQLHSVANAIRRNYTLLTRPEDNTEDTKQIDDDEEFPEGTILSRLHRLRERNSQLVKRKKKQRLQQTGKLGCEACNFDFAEHYGKLGYGFAECHHNEPVSELSTERMIKLSELSIVCPNCHRMLHRVRPWLTVDQLRSLLKERGKLSN